MITEKPQALEGDALQDFFNKEETPTTTVVKPAETLEEHFNEEDEIVVPIKVDAPIKKEEPLKNNFYTDLIKDYIEEGDWEDGAIEIDGEVVNLVDLKNVSADLFKQIKASQKLAKEEELKDKYISKEGIDENTLKILELKKAGGDTRELLQIQAEYVNPLQGLDLDDERVQEYIVRQKLASNPDLDDEDIDNKIRKFKNNLTLDLEAGKVAEEVNVNFTRLIESKNAEHKARVEAQKEEQKNFKKQMTQTFRDLVPDEKIVKSLVESSATFDENGLTNSDRAYFEAKKSPELFAKIALLLSDEDKFNEFYGTKIKNTVNKDTIKKIFKIAPKVTSSQTGQKVGDLEEFFEKNK